MTKDTRSYTTIEVAKRLGVSLQTVQRWVDAGHVKAWKTPGGHRRIDALSAESLFKEQAAGIGTAAATEEASAESAPGQGANPSPFAVVVVDDDAMARDLLVMTVKRALPDASVAAASNGFQGLVAIGKMAPQVVITDIHMPHMNGFEMIRTLLEDAAARPRTLIVVSALSRQELAQMGTLPPEVQVFTKPLDQDRLMALLRSAR